MYCDWLAPIFHHLISLSSDSRIPYHGPKIANSGSFTQSSWQIVHPIKLQHTIPIFGQSFGVDRKGERKAQISDIVGSPDFILSVTEVWVCGWATFGCKICLCKLVARERGIEHANIVRLPPDIADSRKRINYLLYFLKTFNPQPLYCEFLEVMV